MAELVQIDYDHEIDYTITAENQVGAETDTGLRTVPTPGAEVYYVRKFGTDYNITEVTDIEDPVDANMTFTVKALDGTTLGARTGGGAFVAGSTVTAQGCYLEIEADGGDVTVLASITIDTDVDAGGLAFTCAAETIYDGNTLTLYLSDTGSTYYDSSYMYGGGRHTPAADTARKPFFHPYDCVLDGGWGNDDGIEIVDSQTYSFPYKASDGNWYYELPLSVTPCYLYSTDGQAPTIKGDIGASATREVSALFNNVTAVFFNENGTNTDTGATGYEDSWHDPYGTMANALTAAAGKGVSLVIYGGTGATVENNYITIGNTTLGAYTLELEYGYYCTLTGLSSNYISLNNASCNIYGFSLDTIIITTTANWGGDFKNCDCFSNPSIFFRINNTFSGNINNCVFRNNHIGISFLDGTNHSGTISNSLFYNNTTYGIESAILGIFTGSINNCLAYDNGNSGFYIRNDFRGTFENCLAWNNISYGIHTNLTAFTGTIRNCIVWNNGAYDLYRQGTQPTITESNYGTNAAAANDWTIGAGCITTDPKFCKIIYPYRLGISRDSGAYRTDTSSDDMGAHLRIIEINESDIEINGIEFDGNSQFNNAIYIADTADHTGTIIKWCSIHDFHGIQIDLYDNNTDLDAIISNNLIYNGGNGLALSYGGNTLEENCIYNNTIYGIWSDYTGQTFNHNVFFGNYYGLYLESNSGSIIIKNCIFHNNLNYGINSEVSLNTTYCCHADAVNSNVDISSSTNITENPLFVSEVSSSEDFHLKRTERDNIVESPCLDASDTTSFPDMGAYDEDASVGEESWKKFVLNYNPTNMNDEIATKGRINFDDIYGNVHLWGQDQHLILPFKWSDDFASDEEQYNMIRYFCGLIPTRQNGKTESQCEFRVKLLPTSYFGSGTGTIDASAKTLTDSGWYPNQKKGWHVTIKYTSGTATGNLVAASKTLVVTGLTATVDQYEGYYFPYNGYYYYIKSNIPTSGGETELVLSDPNDTLTADASGINWSICKMFKVESNTTTVLTLTDDDSELPDGSYDYYFDFIKSRVITNNFVGNQSGFKWDTWKTKSGYDITFTEVE